MSRPKRIICYAINGAGMGHITRLLGVARWMRRLTSFLDEQAPEILFLTSSDAADLLADAKFAAFKIPSKTIARQAGLDKMEYRRLAKHFVWQTLGVFNPELLVVDTFPSGSFDELFQILDGPFKKSFIYRCVKPEYAARPTFRAAMGFYDAIVAPHRTESISAVQCLTSLPKKLELHCSGEVIQFEREQLRPRSQIRRELGLEEHERLIFISAGGGGDPSVESTLRQIVKAVENEPALRLLIGAGPLYRGDRIAGSNIYWCESPFIYRYFTGCDAAISAGGYNTFHELLYVGVPTLFFAQEKIADDQWRRVQSAEREGACLSIERLDNRSELLEKVAGLLNPVAGRTLSDLAKKFVPDNGAAQCARDLLRPLYPIGRLEWAFQLLSNEVVHELELFSDGEPTVFADWLKPLMPQDRFENLARHPVLESIVQRLSPAAAEELQSVLDQSPARRDQQVVENRLVGLLRAIRSDRTPSEWKSLADETSRGLSVAIKKYSPLIAKSGRDWTSEIVDLLQELTRLIDRNWEIPTLDVLRLFRMFPRVEEVTGVAESIELFNAYLLRRLALSETPQAIMHQLQVLKATHGVVNREQLLLSREPLVE